MINAIKEIGELVEEKDFLKSLVRISDPIDYFVKINFDINKKKISINREECDEKKLLKYLWIGNASGNSKQIYFSTDNLNNILINIIPDTKNYLKDNLNNSDNFNELNKTVEKLFSNFFNQYRNKDFFYLDWNRIEDFQSKLKDFNKKQKSDKTKINCEEFIKINNKGKIDAKKYTEAIKKIYEFNEKNKRYKRYLYTVLINYNSLFEINKVNDQYKKLLEYENLEKLFKKNGKDKKYLKISSCSICNKEDVLCTSKEYAFKFYIQDKPGFSSYMDGDFTKNFSICKECYKKSFTGKSFITNKLKSNIGNNNFYIIPQFFYKSNLNIEQISESIKNLFNPVSNIDSIRDFNIEISRYIKFDDVKNYLIFNYLFYILKDKKNPDSIDVKKVIKGVRPSRFEKIYQNLSEINNNKRFKKYYGNINLNLKKIYYLIPHQTGKSVKYYLNLLEAILKENKINTNKLIKNFREGIKIIRFKNPNYNININERIDIYVFLCNFFLLFLFKMNNIREDKEMKSKKYDGMINMLNEKLKYLAETQSKSKKNNNIKNKYEKLLIYFTEMLPIINNEQKMGLIILGYLLSEIGYQQYKAGLKKKPILNKINYSGMSIKDIIKFSNSIDEKLKQYSIIVYNELLLYLKNDLLLGNLNEWELSKDESVFYILSGYSLGSVYIKTDEDKSKEAEDELDNIESSEEENNN